jgi:hypothetical protein
MKKTGLKKYRNHKLLIEKQVRAHVYKLKMENSDYSSFDEDDPSKADP